MQTSLHASSLFGLEFSIDQTADYRAQVQIGYGANLLAPLRPDEFLDAHVVLCGAAQSACVFDFDFRLDDSVSLATNSEGISYIGSLAAGTYTLSGIAEGNLADSQDNFGGANFTVNFYVQPSVPEPALSAVAAFVAFGLALGRSRSS